MNRSEVLRHLPTLEMFMEQGVWLTLRLRNGHMIRRFCCHEIWALPSPNSSAADYLAVEAHGECRLAQRGGDLLFRPEGNSHL